MDNRRSNYAKNPKKPRNQNGGKRKNRSGKSKIDRHLAMAKQYTHPVYGAMVEIGKNCWVQPRLVKHGL